MIKPKLIIGIAFLEIFLAISLLLFLYPNIPTVESNNIPTVESSNNQEYFDNEIYVLPVLEESIYLYTKDKVSARFYSVEIMRAAQIHSLDPWLLFAIIAKESSFNASAISSAGAKGLMQVMSFWKKEIGSETDNLYNPITSISYGSRILKRYINRYGTINNALAAYNGSKGSMRYPNAVNSIYIKHVRFVLIEK